MAAEAAQEYQWGWQMNRADRVGVKIKAKRGEGTAMRGESGKAGRPNKVAARRGDSTEHVRKIQSARKSSSFSRCERTSAPRAFGTEHVAPKCAIQQTKALRPPMICIPWAIPPWDLQHLAAIEPENIKKTITFLSVLLMVGVAYVIAS